MKKDIRTEVKTAMIELAVIVAFIAVVSLTLTQCTHAASSYDAVALSNNSIKTTHLIDINNVTGRATGGYALALSKNTSVTPERHSGFFAPAIRSASQATRFNGASVISYSNKLYSVYGGMTSQNKAAMPNMRGGTCIPRVNPVTLIPQIMATSQNSKIQGGNHA